MESESRGRPPIVDGEPMSTQKDNSNRTFVIALSAGVIAFVLGVVVFFIVSGPHLNTPTYIMFGTLGLIVTFGVIAVVASKRKERCEEPDYYAFFILGITWLPLGIVLDMPAFWAVGLVFMAVGLTHRDKWKKQPSWKELPSGQQKLKLVLFVVLGALVLAGLVAWYFAAQ